MVSICMNLEGSFSGGSIVAEQFLQSNDTSNGQCHLASDESFTGDSCECLQSHASNDAHGSENTEQEIRQSLLTCNKYYL